MIRLNCVFSVHEAKAQSKQLLRPKSGSWPTSWETPVQSIDRKLQVNARHQLCVLAGWCVAEWAVTPGCGTALARSEWNTTVNGIMWNTCVQHTDSCQSGCCLRAPLFSHAATHTVNVSASGEALCFHQRINRDLLVTFVEKNPEDKWGHIPISNLAKINSSETLV